MKNDLKVREISDLKALLAVFDNSGSYLGIESLTGETFLCEMAKDEQITVTEEIRLSHDLAETLCTSMEEGFFEERTIPKGSLSKRYLPTGHLICSTSLHTIRKFSQLFENINEIASI